MSKNKGQEPIRTCVICRKHLVKAKLRRYVWDSGARAVILDQGRTLPGRGAYCCMDVSCRERFLDRRQGWKRAFRLK